MDSTEFRHKPRLKWEMKQPRTATMLSYGCGGFSVDEKGVLHVIAEPHDEFITSYDGDGRELEKLPLAVGEHTFADPTRVLGLAVSGAFPPNIAGT